MNQPTLHEDRPLRLQILYIFLKIVALMISGAASDRPTTIEATQAPRLLSAEDDDGYYVPGMREDGSYPHTMLDGMR